MAARRTSCACCKSSLAAPADSAPTSRLVRFKAGRPRAWDQSTRAPEALTILAHLAPSVRINFTNSSELLV